MMRYRTDKNMQVRREILLAPLNLKAHGACVRSEIGAQSSGRATFARRLSNRAIPPTAPSLAARPGSPTFMTIVTGTRTSSEQESDAFSSNQGNALEFHDKFILAAEVRGRFAEHRLAFGDVDGIRPGGIVGRDQDVTSYRCLTIGSFRGA